MFRVLIDTDMY